MVDVAPPPHHALLRRRNSIAELTLLSHHHNSTATSSSRPDDLKLLSMKSASHSYTSLKDLLPSPAVVNSPRSNPVHQSQPGSSDICIRNRLVKQAAWAYLQPLSTSTSSGDGNFLHRLLPRLTDFICFVRIALHRMLQIIRIRATI